MAFELLDEHEQSEVVRKWLRENGLAIATGIGLGLLAIFGWQQWQAHKATRIAEMAEQYHALQEAATAQREDDVARIAQALREGAPGSGYAALAALRQADRAGITGDLDGAAQALEWVARHSNLPALKALAQVRLARIRLSAGDADAALKVLDGIPGGAYAALAEEVRGDALVKLGRLVEARTAYAEALGVLESQAANRSFLQMKLDELPPPPSAAAAAPAGKGES